MKLLTAAVAAVCSLSLFSQCSFAHFDFTPKVENNKVATGGDDDETGETVSSLRVGGYDFGEVPADPYNIGDPGFNTQGATAFSPSSALRLAALPIGSAYLSYWDGTGEPTFAAAPAGLSLMLSASPTRTLTYSGTAATYSAASPGSLLIGSFAANGALHVHLTSSLLAAGTAPDGAYLISFELSNPSTGVANSDPLFIVYNNNLTEAQHDAAIDAVAASVVPEPAMLSVAGLAGVALLARKRRTEEADEWKTPV